MLAIYLFHYCVVMWLQNVLVYLVISTAMDDQIWTGGTSLGDESMEVSFPGSGDVITAWSRNFEKSLFLQF